MNTKENYQQKVEAELVLVQAKLAEFKARAKVASADARISYDEQMSELEQRFDDTKTKLKELGEASDGAWENLKDGVESAWSTLSNSVQHAADKFKA
ncbi:coiled coil domain-containing protein [Thiothrix lacustris]|uniref:Coiled coil domain-containing protein n=1 Tax=Thiothrix lacustris TaxID=525917 RepID=A0ABY9MPC7_9GAMM|nr:coiled coil domain-containing protein [Thiothrix lacustris]WML90096.1 coiled coil domain-containing protein [Thiothrix lacustris]WMP18292.1 coiled coil domain-containing protein [Thiothrix lacustris]